MKLGLAVLALSLVALAACGTDEAACGGINNTGTISGPITANCANGNGGVGQAGTTDRHDTTTITNPAPEEHS